MGELGAEYTLKAEKQRFFPLYSAITYTASSICMSASTTFFSLLGEREQKRARDG